mgnify:CR=1 FL=1
MKQALADGADYVGFGPMFPTQSKKDADEVVTPEAEKYALNSTCPSSPSAASACQHPQPLRRSFRSFAMISAIVGKEDMTKAVADIRRILQ